MRNQTRILKLIEELLAKATNKITADYREEQLKAVKAELTAKEADLVAFKEAEKGKVYPDEGNKRYADVTKKHIGDLLIPAHQAELDSLELQISSNDTKLDSYDALQLAALERIEELKKEIEILTIDARNHTGDFQLTINEQITAKTEEITDLEKSLRVQAENLVKTILVKAELSANSQDAKMAKAKLEQNLTSLSKEARVVSFRKIMADTKMAAMEAQIDGLKKRKKLLDTKPNLLAEDLKTAVMNGATEEEIKGKLATLRILAGEMLVDLDSMPKVGFVAVPLEQTIGELNDQKRFYSNNASVLQQNAINNTVLISKMVAGIVYHMELINKAKIIKEQLTTDLKDSEKEFTKLPSIRAKIKRIEEIIGGLELSKAGIFKVLEETVSYNKENAIKQGSSSFIESQATIGLSQLESKNPNPFATSLENLEVTTILLAGEYQVSSREEQVIEPEEPTFIEGLKGEEHSLTEELTNYSKGPDLKEINPNSFTNEPVGELQAAEVTPLNNEVLVTESKVVEDIIPVIPEPTEIAKEPENSFDLMDAYLKAMEEKPEETSKPNLEPLSLAQPLPISTPERPIVPESVREYESRVRTGEINSEKPKMPFPEVVNTQPVNITNLKVLIRKGVGYFKDFLAQPYALPEGADTERGLRVL